MVPFRHSEDHVVSKSGLLSCITNSSLFSLALGLLSISSAVALTSCARTPVLLQVIFTSAEAGKEYYFNLQLLVHIALQKEALG